MGTPRLPHEYATKIHSILGTFKVPYAVEEKVLSMIGEAVDDNLDFICPDYCEPIKPGKTDEEKEVAHHLNHEVEGYNRACHTIRQAIEAMKWK